MPQEQHKRSKMEGDHFDRWLLEAPESDFQEFIDQALKLLPTFSLELLRECKARADARLAAEPETKVYSASDPLQVRLRYWYQIADRFEAEINYRSHRSVANTSGTARNSMRPGAKDDPTVAARRTLVRQHTDLSGKEVCELLDREGIRLPKRWPEAGLRTWTEAWRTRQRRIHVIFSKDRTSG